MGILRTFWNSPIGPKTTHFWGPVVNWSIPIAVCFSTNALKTYKCSLLFLSQRFRNYLATLRWSTSFDCSDRQWQTQRNPQSRFLATWQQVYFHVNVVFSCSKGFGTRPQNFLIGVAVMCIYSALFMRFAYMVQPRNYHLLVCHVANETVQLYQLSRCMRAQG